MLSSLAVVTLISANLLFGWKRTLSYLRYFQQEEYNNRRFYRWLRANRAYDRRGSLALAVAAFASFVTPGATASLIISIVTLIALWAIVEKLESDPRRTGKIKLSMTQRATKTAWLSWGLLAGLVTLPLWVMGCGCGHTPDSPVASAALMGIIGAQAAPFLLMASTIILSPAEKRLQRHYREDAERILQEVDPFTIGITGSYGKTGAKAALGELLSVTLGSTFWPRKSINTVMGITRTIRESLRPHHKYAVIEMGAYNIGSIKRLCDFTPPKAALVTAVGIMHLERFGSPDNVYRAKSEIAQALPPAGILVCNGDSPNARRMAAEHRRETTLLYGFDITKGPLDVFATDITFGLSGTSFVIHYKGERYPGRTPLLGRPALLNALGAIAMACAHGANPAYAVACMANLTPVDNRLVLDPGPTISYLRDAYNSNPTGFEAALEVLGSLPATRRILITPGMIELGTLQYDENKRVAGLAANVCDHIYVVGATNRDAILAGLAGADYPSSKISVVDCRDEAFSALRERAAKGDLVLLENDLGDLHEGAVRF